MRLRREEKDSPERQRQLEKKTLTLCYYSHGQLTLLAEIFPSQVQLNLPASEQVLMVRVVCLRCTVLQSVGVTTSSVKHHPLPQVLTFFWTTGTTLPANSARTSGNIHYYPLLLLYQPTRTKELFEHAHSNLCCRCGMGGTRHTVRPPCA